MSSKELLNKLRHYCGNNVELSFCNKGFANETLLGKLSINDNDELFIDNVKMNPKHIISWKLV